MNAVYLYTGGYTQPIQMGSGETVPGRCQGISCYRFEQESGKINYLHTTSSTPNPSYLLADPKRPYLYCVNELKEYHGVHGSTVSSYAIEPKTGQLRLLNRQFTCGADACHLSFSPDEKYILAANYSGGSFCVLPIQEDRSLGHAMQVLRHSGKGVNPMRQEGPHPHQTILAPDRTHVYVSELGLDKLACYRADWARGWLLPDERLDILGIPGQGIRHGVFDREGRFLYVMTEMSCEVNVYGFDPLNGKAELLQTISAKETEYREPCLGAAIRLHSNGKWLYVSVRGSNHMAVFQVEKDGRLRLIQRLPSGGKIPRDFVLSPNDRYLLVGNQDTDNLCVFGIHPKTGLLTPVCTQEEAFCVTSLTFWQK